MLETRILFNAALDMTFVFAFAFFLLFLGVLDFVMRIEIGFRHPKLDPLRSVTF
jgi:hypothetical protein